MRVLLWPVFLLAPIMAHAESGEDRQAALISQVVAVTDACQRQNLVADLYGALLGGAITVDPAQASLPDTQTLSAVAWQQHLFYVFAGLAEQWPVAQWSREGTALAGQFQSGDRDWGKERHLLAQWQESGQALMSQAPLDCPVASLEVQALGDALARWIIQTASEKASAPGVDG